jgi:hypothetical protein
MLQIPGICTRAQPQSVQTPCSFVQLLPQPHTSQQIWIGGGRHCEVSCGSQQGQCEELLELPDPLELLEDELELQELDELPEPEPLEELELLELQELEELLEPLDELELLLDELLELDELPEPEELLDDIQSFIPKGNAKSKPTQKSQFNILKCIVKYFL